MTLLRKSNCHQNLIDSKSGTVKNIPVGLGYTSLGSGHMSCSYCIGVDSRNNKIYVANAVSGTVSANEPGYGDCCKI
jgi:hypothetical protein